MSARPVVRGGAVAALVALYVAFAVVQATVVNVDPGRHDQSAYLGQAQELARSHFTATTNRMQMPGYPVIQALFVDPAADDASAFFRAKMVNIALSVALLAALHAFFVRTLPRREARVLTLATAFTVFVFRSAYVQTEVVFYTLWFFGFAALCRLWARPSFGAAAVAGLLEGLAFLCKGSVQPGLVLFALLYLGREAWSAARARTGARAVLTRAAELAVLAVAFLAPTAPYCATSERLYGSWFFNVSTHYVVWFDSWDDFMARQTRLGPWWTWGRFPRSDFPSAASYLHDHSVLAIAKREVLGLGESLGNAVIGHGYFEVVVLYGAFAWLAFRGWRGLRGIDARSPAFFALPYVVLYVLLFGFYAPISAGGRFILGLFLPTLFTILRAGASRQPSAVLGGRQLAWDDMNRLMLALLAIHVAFVLPATIGRIYAGG